MIEPSHHAAKAAGPAQAPAVFEEPSMTEVTIDNVTEPKIALDGLDDSIASLPVPREQGKFVFVSKRGDQGAVARSSGIVLPDQIVKNCYIHAFKKFTRFRTAASRCTFVNADFGRSCSSQ